MDQLVKDEKQTEEQAQPQAVEPRPESEPQTALKVKSSVRGGAIPNGGRWP